VELDGSLFIKASRMNLYVTQQLLLQFHLLTIDGSNYATFPTGTTWYFGIDTSFASDHDDVVQVGDSDFVASDWNEADFNNGKVCCRVDLTSSALITALGSSSELTGYAGLWATAPGEKPLCVCEWQITLKNLATYVREPAEQQGVTYVTTDMLTPYLLKQTPYHDTWFKDGIMYKFCSDDNKWYPIGLRLVDGRPTLVIGENGLTTEEM